MNSNAQKDSRRSFLRTAVTAGAGTMMLGRSAVGQNADLTQLSLVEAAELVRSLRVSPVELTRACLDRIQRLQPILNAFITVTGEEALSDARKAEVEILQGHWRGALHGIPVGVKDEFDTAGVRTTGGSRVFLDRVPDEDADVVRRLKAAGAIFLGKLNMDEFGGGIGVFWTSYFGPVHNPWDPNRYAGPGSSTGSAAAIAAGLCYGALGADTGGSIRGPASWSGTVGLKPTFGRVSKRGAISYSWSLDHVGPMTRTIADTAAMLQVVAGYDLASGYNHGKCARAGLRGGAGPEDGFTKIGSAPHSLLRKTESRSGDRCERSSVST